MSCEPLTPEQQAFLEAQLSDPREREVFCNFTQRYRETYRGLTEEQRAVVRTLEGPVFVSAGAGSGKTFTLTQRVIYALTKGSGGPETPYLSGLDQALIITFTRDAANEIKERLRSALYDAGMRTIAQTVDDAWVSTIHRMCARIIREHALELGIDPNFGLLEPDDAALSMQRAAEQAVEENLQNPEFQELIDEYGLSDSDRSVSVISMVRDVLTKSGEEVDGIDSVRLPGVAAGVPDGPVSELEMGFARAAGLSAQLLELSRIARGLYDAEKRAQGLLDNTDLLREAYRALTEHEVVRAAYRGRFKLVMVDEFQDTSTIQFRTISELAGEGCRHLATVGDAQQSIYRFRGADVEVFKQARSDPHNTLLEMGFNFRSHEQILQFVEHVCKGGEMIPEADYLHLEAGRDEARVEVPYPGGTGPRIFLETANGSGAMTSARPMVAAQIADRLARMRDENGIAASDMALLLGGMGNASVYIEALRARGLECVMTKGSVFDSLDEVNVIKLLVRALSNPHDTKGALVGLLTSEMFGLDANELVLLRCGEEDGALKLRKLWQGLLASGAEGEPARLWIVREALARAMRSMPDGEPADVCMQVVRDSGWLARLAVGSPETAAVRTAKAANILRALRILREVAQKKGAGWSTLPDLYERYLKEAKLAPAQLTGERPNAVSIMTIHGSKGLEFPVVAMAEFTGGSTSVRKLAMVREDDRVVCALAPNAVSSKDLADVPCPEDAEGCESALDWYLHVCAVDEAQDLQEAARKVYVGLTRAKEALVVGLPIGRQSDLETGRTGWAARALWRGEAARAYTQAGETPLDAEGYAYEGVSRTAWLAKNDDDLLAVDAGDALSTPAGVWLGADELAYVHPDAVAVQADPAFALYPLEERAEAVPYSMRAGVYSFSSASAAVGLHAEPAEAPRAEEVDNDEDLPPAEAFDPNRATSFGSAVHACCEAMVNEGLRADEVLPEAQLEAIAKTWGVCAGATSDAKGLDDLRAAVNTWAGCALRREVLDGYARVEAEVPFFVEAESQFGEYLEGYIDLLATNEDAHEALVVDYKTGYLSHDAASFAAAHEMQANFYAHVLLDAGYKRVTCAFVAVQRRGDDGKPLVAKYGPFTAQNPANLEVMG